MEEIARMQKHLLLIRRAVGWTAEEFGDRIGVTRQTINNIESSRSRLTKTQYLAMRSVLDAEILRAPEDTGMLRVLLDVLVDRPENYSAEERDKVLENASMLAPSILAGTTTRAKVSGKMLKDLGALAGLSAGALLGTLGLGVGLSSWLGKAVTGGKIKLRK